MTDKADIVEWLNSLTCEDKDCDGRGTRHIPGYAGEKISLGCDWCDTRSATLALIASQAAEIELLKRVARETALQHHNWNQRNASLIGEQAAEIERLREQSETTRKRERANEDQLVRIASHLGGDATNAPESDRTIAGFAIAEIERLKTLLAYSRLPPHKQWETGWP